MIPQGFNTAVTPASERSGEHRRPVDGPPRDRRYATLIRPALQWLWRFHKGKMFDSTTVTYAERKALYESAKPEIDSAAEFISSLRLRDLKLTMAPPLALFCFLLFRRQNSALAEKFFTDVARGSSLHVHDPSLQFNNAVRWNRKLASTKILALAFKSWNLLLNEDRVEELKLEKDEARKLFDAMRDQQPQPAVIDEGPPPWADNATAFDYKKRPYDHLLAAEFIAAVFKECPDEHKPHLLLRIVEMIGRDAKPMSAKG
jgi:hypothetical protein